MPHTDSPFFCVLCRPFMCLKDKANIHPQVGRCYLGFHMTSVLTSAMPQFAAISGSPQGYVLTAVNSSWTVPPMSPFAPCQDVKGTSVLVSRIPQA